ncbi:hypothetical protein ACOME3_001773 [Neoechinorhynchus agilis]
MEFNRSLNALVSARNIISHYYGPVAIIASILWPTVLIRIFARTTSTNNGALSLLNVIINATHIVFVITAFLPLYLADVYSLYPRLSSKMACKISEWLTQLSLNGFNVMICILSVSHIRICVSHHYKRFIERYILKKSSLLTALVLAIVSNSYILYYYDVRDLKRVRAETTHNVRLSRVFNSFDHDTVVVMAKACSSTHESADVLKDIIGATTNILLPIFSVILVGFTIWFHLRLKKTLYCMRASG